MNNIKLLKDRLSELHSDLSFEDCEPRDKVKGVWWLDISCQRWDHKIVVEWDPEHDQFGVCTRPNPDPNSGSNGYGTTAADVYSDGLEEAVKEIDELIRTGHHTVPSWKL